MHSRRVKNTLLTSQHVLPRSLKCRGVLFGCCGSGGKPDQPRWSRLIAIKIPPQKPAATAAHAWESDLLFFFLYASEHPRLPILPNSLLL